MARLHDHFVVLPQAKFTRAVTFRCDGIGVYLLFWENEDLRAGWSFQYPSWVTGSHYLKPGFSGFNWEELPRYED